MHVCARAFVCLLMCLSLPKTEAIIVFIDVRSEKAIRPWLVSKSKTLSGFFVGRSATSDLF